VIRVICIVVAMFWCHALMAVELAERTAQTSVNVVGLFAGKAVVMINGGSPLTLSVGQTKKDVKLISANSRQAVFLIEGKRKTLRMGQAATVAGAGGGSQASQAVKLFAAPSGHFFGEMTVNHKRLRYVVDTGATSVAMSSFDAKRAGVDYLKGVKGRSSTANGIVTTYRIKLNTLKLDGITLHNVDASVIEGGFPEVVLLGMTALNRMKMERANGVLTLTKKY